MTEHYYTKDPTSRHEEHAFALDCAGRTLQFETDAGVFSKLKLDTGTALLLKALPETFHGRALDLGCGWGPVGCCMAARWPQAEIALCDINERAVELARANLERNRLRGEAFCGDGLDAVEGQFDLIAVNPPIRAGKAVVYKLFAQSAQRLGDGGCLYVVMRKAQGAESAEKELKTRFARVETVERGSGYRVFRAEK